MDRIAMLAKDSGRLRTRVIKLRRLSYDNWPTPDDENTPHQTKVGSALGCSGAWEEVCNESISGADGT